MENVELFTEIAYGCDDGYESVETYIVGNREEKSYCVVCKHDHMSNKGGKVNGYERH